MKTGENWITEPLPDGVSRLAASEVQDVLARFSKLVELRPAPIPGTPRSEQYAFFCPKRCLIVKAVPGGVASLDAEEGYDYDRCLDRFFAELGSRNYFWAIGSEDIGLFEGPFTEEIRWWIKRNIIVTPTVIMSPKIDLVLISDEQWHFSLVGGGSKEIAALESAFGGAANLRTNFLNWVEQDGVGFGEEGRLWAYKYPVSWSGWDE